MWHWEIMLKIQLCIKGINDIFKYIKTIILNSNNISQSYYFYSIFDQINAALRSIRNQPQGFEQ